MTVYFHIIKDSPVKIWGMTSRQRKLRVLESAGVIETIQDIEALPDNSSVVFCRGDYLFDDRVIHYMVQASDVILEVSQGGTPVFVAAHVSAGRADQVREAIAGNLTSSSLPADVKIETLKTLAISFQERLLKFEPPFVLPITSDNARILERRLFDWSYKGVTDLVTKWVWPRPAQWVVGQCVRYGLRPNHVTIIGLMLVILAGIFFAYGLYGWGLLAGWLMTFLDTVDGKLARVTVTSSKFGHYFDHIIDLIHPPIWYILWGMGLGITHFSFNELPLGTAYWLIVIGYAGGRLVEGIFLAWLGKFGLFCWRPIDSYFRLITARRNPCMILLTAGVLGGHPEWGLFAVTVWTVLTSVFLLIRLLLAVKARLADGVVRSWLLDIDQNNSQQPLAVKLFTHRADD
jgi:phosphatidylglycerophosphate synthase